MSGGKGGSTVVQQEPKETTQTMEIPEYLEAPLRRNISKAEELAQIGFTPYMGLDVAAVTPMQEAAMRNTAMAAQAYGLEGADPMAGMPQAQTVGGVRGYSSFPIYEQALAELEARMPGQYAALRAPFIDPVTGERPMAPFGSGGSAAAPVAAPSGSANVFNGSSRVPNSYQAQQDRAYDRMQEIRRQQALGLREAR